MASPATVIGKIVETVSIMQPLDGGYIKAGAGEPVPGNLETGTQLFIADNCVDSGKPLGSVQLVFPGMELFLIGPAVDNGITVFYSLVICFLQKLPILCVFHSNFSFWQNMNCIITTKYILTYFTNKVNINRER